MVGVRRRILVVFTVKLSGEPQETPTILIADPALAIRQKVPFSAASPVAGAAYHAISRIWIFKRQAGVLQTVTSALAAATAPWRPLSA
jgi:hypothetical protein